MLHLYVLFYIYLKLHWRLSYLNFNDFSVWKDMVDEWVSATAAIASMNCTHSFSLSKMNLLLMCSSMNLVINPEFCSCIFRHRGYSRFCKSICCWWWRRRAPISSFGRRSFLCCSDHFNGALRGNGSFYFTFLIGKIQRWFYWVFIVYWLEFALLGPSIGTNEVLRWHGWRWKWVDFAIFWFY